MLYLWILYIIYKILYNLFYKSNTFLYDFNEFIHWYIPIAFMINSKIKLKTLAIPVSSVSNDNHQQDIN